jgi:hypothetical protein
VVVVVDGIVVLVVLVVVDVTGVVPAPESPPEQAATMTASAARTSFISM